VEDNVIDARDWLLCKFEIQPDAAGFGIAGAPFGFHPFDAPFGSTNAQNHLPLRYQRGHEFTQLLAIPAPQRKLAISRTKFGPHVQFERGAVANNDTARSIMFKDTQPIPPSKKIVALASNHLSSGLSGLCLKAGALSLDPSEPTDYGESHCIFR
jgi:hypothetical protein